MLMLKYETLLTERLHELVDTLKYHDIQEEKEIREIAAKSFMDESADVAMDLIQMTLAIMKNKEHAYIRTVAVPMLWHLSRGVAIMRGDKTRYFLDYNARLGIVHYQTKRSAQEGKVLTSKLSTFCNWMRFAQLKMTTNVVSVEEVIA